MGIRMSFGGHAPGSIVEPPAACSGLFDLFFADTQEEVDLAKSICAGCARRRQCLRSALERRESCGVWGGELLRDGQILREVPRRGRPASVA